MLLGHRISQLLELSPTHGAPALIPWLFLGVTAPKKQKLFANAAIQQFSPLENASSSPEQLKVLLSPILSLSHRSAKPGSKSRSSPGLREQSGLEMTAETQPSLVPSPRLRNCQEITTVPGMIRGEGLRTFPRPCGAQLSWERLPSPAQMSGAPPRIPSRARLGFLGGDQPAGLWFHGSIISNFGIVFTREALRGSWELCPSG